MDYMNLWGFYAIGGNIRLSAQSNYKHEKVDKKFKFFMAWNVNSPDLPKHTHKMRAEYFEIRCILWCTFVDNFEFCLTNCVLIIKDAFSNRRHLPDLKGPVDAS